VNVAWAVVAGMGFVVLALSIAGARHPTISAPERAVFLAVNGLPRVFTWFVWLPMQLGNLVVGTLAGLAVAWWAGRTAVAVGVILAMALKLVTERIVRKEMAAYLSVRQRPGTSQPGAVLRGGDVPRSGPSFPSGHVILVAAVACVVSVEIPAGWVWVPFVLTGLVMLGRVHVGAHNPLDVTAGVGTGLLLGGAIAMLI
jgi:undecaprenyl-diphosphatase